MAIGSPAPPTGLSQEGPYVDGKEHGHWVIRWSIHWGGGVWEGPYVDGKWHGHWVERSADGTVSKKAPMWTARSMAIGSSAPPTGLSRKAPMWTASGMAIGSSAPPTGVAIIMSGHEAT